MMQRRASSLRSFRGRWQHNGLLNRSKVDHNLVPSLVSTTTLQSFTTHYELYTSIIITTSVSTITSTSTSTSYIDITLDMERKIDSQAPFDL